MPIALSKVRFRQTFFLFIILLSTNLCGQRSSSLFDDYVLSEYFKPQFEKDFTKIIERDSEGDIIRIWEFNQAGQLIRECDRRAGWASGSVNDVETVSYEFSYKEYNYAYLTNGHLEGIIEIDHVNGDTLISTHTFDYSISNEIWEVYEYDVRPGLSIEFTEISKMSQGRIDTLLNVRSNYIEGAMWSSKTMEIWSYNDLGKLAKKERIVDFEDEATISSVDIYHYDRHGRLKEMISTYQNEGETKQGGEISLYYTDEESKVSSIHVLFSEVFSPREIDCNIFYDDEGRLKSLTFGEKEFFYTFE